MSHNDILLHMNDLQKFKNLNYDFSSILIDGHSILHWVSGQGNSDVLAYLISKGCPMDTKTCRGYTILHEACAFGNNSNAHHILCNDKNMISTVSNDGRTILHEICKYNKIETLKYMYQFHKEAIEKIANYKDKDDKKATDYINSSDMRFVAMNTGLL